MKIKSAFNYLNKILIFYLPGTANYWHTITTCNITVKPDKINKYYLDFSDKYNYPGRFSEAGVPLFVFQGKEFFHPTVISQFGFGIFELLYRSSFNNAKLMKEFLAQADWLLINGKKFKDGIVWHLNYNIIEYGLKAPWISALSQGEAISILCRAYILTNNKEYLSCAEKAIVPFKYNVKEGGLQNFFKGHIIYEEYPSVEKVVGVLNGFIFSLFGLYDLFLTTNNTEAKNLFFYGLDSLKKLLIFYDMGFWAGYYLLDYPQKYFASFTYINIMSEQLKALYIITGDRVFYEYSEKWHSYQDSFLNKNRVLISKIVYSLKLKLSL